MPYPRSNKTGNRRRVPVGLRSSIVGGMPVTMGAWTQLDADHWYVQIELPEPVTVLPGLTAADPVAVALFNSQMIMNITDTVNSTYGGLLESVAVDPPSLVSSNRVTLYFACTVGGTPQSGYLALPADGSWCVSTARGVGISGVDLLPTVPNGMFYQVIGL